jgi:hypothetical protein
VTVDADVPVPVRLSLFAGSSATVSLLELGDRSPLKAALPDFAWTALLTQAPRLIRSREELRSYFHANLASQLEARDLSLVRLVAGGAAAALAGLPSAGENRLEQGVLIYSSGALLGLVRDGVIARKLIALTFKPGVPADVRKEAAALVALGAALVVQQEIALARFLAGLDGRLP